MYAANTLAVRGGWALSNGCRGGVTSRPYSSSTARRRNHRPSNEGSGRSVAVATSAGAACVMCTAVRNTAACSASTVVHLRGASSSSSSSPSSTVENSLLAGAYRGQRPHFGSGMGPAAAVAWEAKRRGGRDLGRIGASVEVGSRMLSYSSSHVNNALALPGSVCGITGSVVGANGIALTSQEAILHGDGASGWSFAELAGAMLFAGGATAGMLLGGPVDRPLPGKLGGGGGGGGGPGGGSGGGTPVGGGGQGNQFDTGVKDKEGQQEKPEVGLGIASVAKPYEVSVRALRGGRLSMEDEFVVVNGGRLSAVYDGHGGGGVSQYLRDRLHVIITEQLKLQEKCQKSNSKGLGLKRFFGSKKLVQAQEDGSTDDGTDSTQNKFDLSNVGSLPISAVETALKDSFDQADKEILHNSEYEYQGSTAVVTLLHEANDGTRTLLSANVGDSRAILSRKGSAVDLTRDHKPNDGKEKARILAMGEKIEWDHYCKVHRVRNLSLSRAMGDRFAKPAVSGDVEIKRFPIYDNKDEFILLASDGLFDVMSSQEVVSYINKRLKAPPKDGADINNEEDMASLVYLRRKNMSRFVANEALRRGSGDNISVVIVWLSDTPPILR